MKKYILTIALVAIMSEVIALEFVTITSGYLYIKPQQLLLPALKQYL